MAREKTCEIAEKIKQYLGVSIPCLDRLTELDTSIWKLEMLSSGEATYSQRIYYKKRTILGYSRRISNRVDVKIDDEMAEKIRLLFEEEYKRQVKICEDLISKLECNNKQTNNKLI